MKMKMQKTNKLLSTITLLTLAFFALIFTIFVSATPAWYLQTQNFDSDGVAEWTTDEWYSRGYSVYLSAPAPPSPPGVCGAGRVVIPYNQKLNTITDMGFWYNLKEGNPGTNENSAPYIYFALDTNDDENEDTWVIHEMIEISTFDTWLQWELSDDPIPPGNMYGKTNMWHVFPGDTPYDEWADVLSAFGDDTVLKVKVAVGEWLSSVTTTYYVDDATINTVTYTFERPVGGDVENIDRGALIGSVISSYWWIPVITVVAVAPLLWKRRRE